MLRLPDFVRDLFRRRRGGLVAPVPLLRQPQPRVHEMDRGERFAATMEQSAATDCQVIIQGGIDNPAGGGKGITWYDLEVFFSGPWSRELPVPDITDVVAVVRAEGLRYGRHVVRATI